MTRHEIDDEQSAELRRPAGALTPLEGLREAVSAAAEALTTSPSGGAAAGAARTLKLAPGGGSSGRAGITLERSPRAKFGDYATNAALLLAPGLGSSPREVAEELGLALRERLGPDLERFEVAGPGFVNLFLSDSWLRGALAQVIRAGDQYGAGGVRAPERVLVEFVSANPTGPMHVGHARNAAYGDALARMLTLHGHKVQREFYVNDAGSQIRKLGESIHALALGEEPPPDGYRGQYMAELAAGIENAASLEPLEAGRAAVGVMVEHIQSSLRAFGVESFDGWVYERTLHEGEPSPVEHSISILTEHGRTYLSEGAVWLRTTDFGDDKDRVLVRSNGEHTYFATDIAYHQHKRERGFERQIDVWGADHHGYVARMKAAYEALGGDPAELELLIMQLVHLIRSGERAQMSKRAGEFVTLDDLIAEIGVDAARWYLLTRSHDTTVDLDLDLAREQSSENPVYYVQYAHARIASMLSKAGPERVSRALSELESGEADTLHAAERALVQQLLAFPQELAEAVERRAPHRVAAYVLELAQGFTAFYRDCRVLGAEPDHVESLRIGLCLATRNVIARSLGLLGVSAPEQM